MLRSKLFLDHHKQKKLGKLSFFCVCIIILTVIGISVWYQMPHSRRETVDDIAVAKIVSSFRGGDVVLRSGVGMWSGLFREYNEIDKRFSHVGIVVEKDGKFFILHAEANDLTGQGEVHLSSAEDFIRASSEVGISRLHALDRKIFVENALKLQGRKFDWKFDRKESETLYCTELVDLALRSVPGGESGLAVGKNDIIPIDSCLYGKYFTEVIPRNDMRHAGNVVSESR